jgi:hypothetical protein
LEFGFIDMTMTQKQQKIVLGVLLAALAFLVLYRIMTADEPRTAPLTYTQGAIATSAVRPGLASRSDSADPLNSLLRKQEEQFPGVMRDIFRTANPAPKPKKVLKPVTAPTPTLPPVPVKTPEEIAADLARADLSKFRFVGSMTDQESSFFLTKDGESFIVKKGDTVQKSYTVKGADKDSVILHDTITQVEVRITLSGSEEQKKR